MNDDPSAADPFGQIADEFVEAFRQGRRPSVEEFARRYPEHAGDIREVLPALVLMEKAKAAEETPGPRRQPTAAPLRQLGDYQILREVGRGGMGVVYEARQLSLGRHVAIKVLPAHALLDPRQLGRFQREARSAARLHHTNIVPVFGVGEEGGLHYYVMQFIQGLGLDVVLDELRRLRQPKGKPTPTQGDAPGCLTNPNRNVSAVDMARGLLSGEFRQPGPAGDLTTAPRRASPVAAAPGDPAASSALRAADSTATIHLPGQSEGSTLSESGGQYWKSVARVGVQVADALAHAASQGVLHRDVKPSNLLLDEKGNVWVTDFGLAKAASDSDDLTHTGDVVGTLRYLAPERFNGQGDLRSDVYSLGLTLYELLTLWPAFDDTDRNRLVKQVMHGEPVRPRRLNPAVPRDLETVVLKAIARLPSHRYQTPADMADDLKRFIEDRPVRARRISGAERLWRWCRRNPDIAVLGGALAVLLVLVTVASLLAAGHFNRLRWSESQAAQNERDAREAESSQRQRAESEKQRADYEARLARNAEGVARDLAQAEAKARKLAQQETQRAEAEKKRAEEQLTRAEWLVYTGKLSLAQNDFEAGNGGFALQYLDDCQWNLRGWEHRYLWSRINSKQTFPGHRGSVWGVAFSPDGKRIVTGGQDTTARVWDAEKGRQLLALRGHTTPVRGVAFSPDGKRILTGAGDPGKPGEAKVWDAATGREILSLKGLKNEVWGVAFSPGGKRIVTGGGNRVGSPGEAKVWDAGTGRELLALDRLAACVSSVVFSPDGKRIVTGSWDSTARVWDAEKGRELLALRGHTSPVRGVAFSPDGKRILTGSDDRTAKVWDAQTGQEALALKGHTGGVWGAVFSPDGKRILTGSHDQTAKVWDAQTGQKAFALKGHSGEVWGVAFSPDGKRIVTGSNDQTARAWDAERGQNVLALRGHTGEILSVAFSPNGKRIVAGSRDRTARVWDAATGQEALALKGHAGEVWGVAFSPDAKRILTGSTDQTARVWDAQTGQEVLALKGHKAQVISVAFSPDGKRIVTGSYDRTAKVWDAATGQELLALKGQASWVPQLDYYRAIRAGRVAELLALKGHTSWVWGVAFSPDGKRIVTASEDRTVKVWDAQTGRELRTLKGHAGIVWSVAFSPDGKRLVSSSDDRTAKVWDAATGQGILVLKGHTAPVFSAVFSPDGKRIVTGAGDLYRPGETKLWDAATGQEVLTLKGHAALVRSVAFSLDGKRIVTGSADGTAKVWVADRVQEVLALKGHTADVTCTAFSPDGKRLVSGSHDRTVRVWDAVKGQEVLALEGHTGAVASVAFSPDGKRIFAWDAQKKVLAWSAADGKPVAPVDAPPAPRPGPARSPDGFLRAVPQGNTIAVTDTSHLAKRFPAVLRGQDEPADNAERLAFAQLARDHKEFAFATRLWAEALASDPMLGDDRQAQHRYNAARAAALAAGGQGEVKPPLDAAKAKFRRHALDWLKAELTAWDKQIESGPPQDRLTIVLTLSDWKHENDLTGIRDAAALAKLPAEEQKAFLQLWADVAQLKKKAWVKSGAFLQEQLPGARKALPKDSPELAYLLAQIGMAHLEQEQWAQAEPFNRECLGIRKKAQPDSWVTFNAQSMLGAALLGQKKYAEAEPLLLEGYAGMKEREDTIPPVGKDRLSEAVERLVQLYDAMGKKDEAAKWGREVEAPRR
jgi:WD40 repeat protein/serine/threonine protein kinase